MLSIVRLIGLLFAIWAVPVYAATVNGTVVNAGANVTKDGITGTGFFIPISGSSGINQNYGVGGAGQSSSSGTTNCSSGCNTLTMDVHFTGLQAGVGGVLTINFSDFDIFPFNDNNSTLRETLRIVANASNGPVITGVTGGTLSNISTQTPSGNGQLAAVSNLTTGGQVTGNDITQQIVLSLTNSLLTSSTFDLFLIFQALDTGGSSYHPVYNTLEVLNASISQVSQVPLPGAAILFGTGLLGLAGLARRRREKRSLA